ncbi:McrC family protein [Amycolatopsis azurea]|uniref:McrC family protein n=1 Tax=Amycolatopsis azurea TaxID=36819 RepID=UPI0037F3E81C
MTVLGLIEHGAPLSVPLDDAVGRAIAASRIADARPDMENTGHWRIRARGTVGAATLHVPGHDVVSLRIQPKIPIARLLFMLGYSQSPKGWRVEDVQVDEDRELLPVMARLFALQAEKALRQGLLSGYREVEETALVARGRIRTTDQSRKHYDRLVPLETTRDEFTSDIAENRILRAASEVLLRLPDGVPDEVRRQLLGLRVRLAGVTPVGTGHPFPSWRPSRLNARYHRALRLADLVSQGDSVENRPGDVTVSGFMFDMPRVFEDFVTIALREALVKSTGYCVLQAAHHLDEASAIRMIPDFVRYADDDRPLAVADAKYKAERPKGFPDADLYQMLAYCTALNLKEGHLIYAKGHAAHGLHRVKHAGITIHQHALELDQTPEELREDIQKLAQRLAPAL